MVNNDKGFLSTLQEECKVDSITYEKLNEIVKNNWKDIFVIMEGSLEFMTLELNYLTQQHEDQINENKVKMCLLFTNRVRMFNFCTKALWVRLGHHKDAGGATSTMTQGAFIPKEIWKKVKEENQRWFLTDFLKPTIRGKQIELGIAQHILLNTNNVVDLYRAPCVFASTGWMERRLTPSEILRCLDVPQSVDQKLIAEIGNDFTSLTWKQVLRAVPGKTEIIYFEFVGS